MHRFTNHLVNANLILVRKQVGDKSCSALIVMRSPIRQYAKDQFAEKCPPANKPPKSRKLLYGTIGATILTGAAVVYAKSSPDARNFLASNVPWANDFVTLVYQEDQTYFQFSVNQFNKISRRLSDFMFGKEGVAPLDFQQRSEQNIDKDAEKGFAPKEYKSTLIQTDKCDPEQPPSVKITKDIVQLEQEMHENTKIAIDNYKRALRLCETYNKALYKIVELPIENCDKKYFAALKGARDERDAAIKKGKEASTKAKCAIETLDRMIKDSHVAAPPENVAVTLRYLKQFRADLSAAEEAFKAEQERAVLSDKYCSKVEAARGAYRTELEQLFPGVDLNARKLDIRSDADLLLIYTLKQIQYLQNELAELQTVRELKLNRALECRDEKMLIEAKVEDMINKERIQKELEFQKRSLEITAEAHRKMKDQLSKQAEIQQEVLQSRVNKKEQEVMGRVGRAVSEQVEKERVKFKKELAAMAGKLQAIEATLKRRAKAEADAKRSQSLWAAAESLLAATRRAAPETKVDNEIKALENAGKDDQLVQTVLKGIPPTVREKGIATETALRDRFEKLEKTAMKVALIGRDGASLPMYFLSWVQSKFIFQKLAEIPRDELENLPTDFSKLDTFDIIQRARYYIDHGNLAHALRYVNLLQGAPRAAAHAWADAARQHLEVKQAAEAVMAHASLSGMIYT